jgi:hypothetical protein
MYHAFFNYQVHLYRQNLISCSLALYGHRILWLNYTQLTDLLLGATTFNILTCICRQTENMKQTNSCKARFARRLTRNGHIDEIHIKAVYTVDCTTFAYNCCIRVCFQKATTFFVLHRTNVGSCRVNLHCTIGVVSAWHATVVSKSCTV